MFEYIVKVKVLVAQRTLNYPLGGAGLEGFVDWVDPNASDPIEEREDDMSSLAVGFSSRMRKQAANAQGKNTPDSEVFGGKRPNLFGLDEEA